MAGYSSSETTKTSPRRRKGRQNRATESVQSVSSLAGGHLTVPKEHIAEILLGESTIESTGGHVEPNVQEPAHRDVETPCFVKDTFGEGFFASDTK
jgi:hypothetical protein